MKPINTPFVVHAPYPIDTRTQVSTYGGLALIPVIYEGLLVYVVDEDKEYRYYSSGWVEWSDGSGGGGGAGVWGSITGVLTDQTDLNSALLLKFDKAGGTITGDTTVTAVLEAYNIVTFGSAPATENPYPQVVDPPASASDTGTAGQIAYDSNYFYVCTATDTWVRAALNTW